MAIAKNPLEAGFSMGFWPLGKAPPHSGVVRTGLKQTVRLSMRLFAALARPRYATSIADLPTEILTLIFGLVDDADQLSLRATCSRFNTLVLQRPRDIPVRKPSLVSCLTVSFAPNENAVVLENVRKSESIVKRYLTIPVEDIRNGTLPDLSFCFRRLNVLGVQIHNICLEAPFVEWFCEMIRCVPCFQPKTLRLSEVACHHVESRHLHDIVKLCSKHLNVISFMNLLGIQPDVLTDDIFSFCEDLYVFMIQGLSFHASVPSDRQYLEISDATLQRIPLAIRKIKVERCGGITSTGVCAFLERFAAEKKPSSDTVPSSVFHHQRTSELIFRMCPQVTTVDFEAEAERRNLPVDDLESQDYIMKWVKRRQYIVKDVFRKKLLSIEIDSHVSGRLSGCSTPCNPQNPFLRPVSVCCESGPSRLLEAIVKPISSSSCSGVR
uniref:F-box domain-containing protein n=1 Tax=Steinernema glaseri TaxID=37863 RepID=A0A1I8ACJ8_9BILA